MRPSLLATCGVLVGCGAAPPAAIQHLDAPEGYSIVFPASVETRSGREGPFVFRIDSARTADGARFEAAWFGFPEPLDAPDREALLRRVEKGLAGGPGTTVVSRSSPEDAPAEAVDLVLDRGDGRRGFHRVLYPSRDAMLQVSAVGPRDGHWERDVPRFWSSVALSTRVPSETHDPPRPSLPVFSDPENEQAPSTAALMTTITAPPRRDPPSPAPTDPATP